ncbi:FAR1 DNA-binding domain [Sesbania bispinosa]|nr:FAR1 DNA-binding domain [Sesbania bispinosa]
MDSSVVMGSTILEPRNDMEFESHEAAYAFYKEYAKSAGFGTAKLSSRRSRASKEFIDAKFSCIRYGNKQQSDDAINPRPSPKIGCKASMHVKRRQDGKWYVYSFVKEHNHELLPAQAHFFRSHRSSDPLEEQFEKRWWKLVDRFNLRDVEWVQSLYDDRICWVPTFMRDISFAGLSTSLRSESLNSLFDNYVQVDTSLKEFIEQYRVILEDRHEEEAKANFDAWHETPELKSPSPFEKQMLLVYTHEIYKKFQVEVLGAAACHLKKENEGYPCRHAIVVLQMSGVFSIPPKYILQRWTNAAMSRHPIGEKLEEVQSKVRRFNDLCRRAIILGEEGSLSQDSYYIALGAISEALKQCANLNNCVENGMRPDASTTHLVCNVEEEYQSIISSNNKVPDPKMNMGKKAARTGVAGRSLGSVENIEGNKGKVPQLEAMSGKDGFQQMEPTDLRSHNVLPMQFQSMVPALFHNVSSPFHTAASTHLHENRLPR